MQHLEDELRGSRKWKKAISSLRYGNQLPDNDNGNGNADKHHYHFNMKLDVAFEFKT